MKRLEQDHLLREILASEHLSVFKQATLETGLSAMRQRRHRRTYRFVLLACLSVGTGVLVWFKPVRVQKSTPQRQYASGPQTAVSFQNDRQGVKSISDSELFALFPEGPLALIGKPGYQQLVFLNREERTSNP